MSVRKRTWTKGNEVKTAWVVDYTDQGGKRRLKTFKLKKDADRFAASAKVEVGAGTHIADSDTITIADAGKNWILSGEAAGLERTTIDQRRQHLDLHIKPLIGDTKLNVVTAPFVRQFQDTLREAGRSPAMIKRVTVSLGSILGDAQDKGHVIRNAVRERSRKKGANGTEKRQKARLRVGVDIPANAELKAILGAAAGRWRPLLITLAFTGLRASEARGLRWLDVDLGKGELNVSQRADRYRDIGAPKSNAGHRRIPLTPMVIRELTAWWEVCPKGAAGLVFPNTEGGVEFHQNMLQRGYLPTQLAAGVTVEVVGKMDDDGNPVLAAKYPGFHALRHWYASWCINRRADGGLELSPKAVQERMGHSSIQVTFDTYGHLFPAVDEKAHLADAEAALFGASAT